MAAGGLTSLRASILGRRNVSDGAGTCQRRGAVHVARMASKPLKAADIKLALGELPGWKFQREALAKTFTFGDFREALSFMVRAGFEADAMNHHPQWTNVYNRVVIRLNTHDAGGRVTAKDVALAKKFQALSWVG